MAPPPRFQQPVQGGRIGIFEQKTFVETEVPPISALDRGKAALVRAGVRLDRRPEAVELFLDPGGRGVSIHFDVGVGGRRPSSAGNEVDVPGLAVGDRERRIGNEWEFLADLELGRKPKPPHRSGAGVTLRVFVRLYAEFDPMPIVSQGAVRISAASGAVVVADLAQKPWNIVHRRQGRSPLSEEKDDRSDHEYGTRNVRERFTASCANTACEGLDKDNLLVDGTADFEFGRFEITSSSGRSRRGTKGPGPSAGRCYDGAVGQR